METATIQLVEEAFEHLHKIPELGRQQFAPLRQILLQKTEAIALRETPLAAVLLRDSLVSALERQLAVFDQHVRVEFALSYGLVSLAVGIGQTGVGQPVTTTTLIRFPAPLVSAFGALIHYKLGMSHEDLKTLLDIPSDNLRKLVYSGRNNAAYYWMAVNGYVAS